MKNYKDLIFTLSKINKDDLFHVFLIPNQTSAIVTKLIISVFNLNKENFILVPLRKTNTSFINGPYFDYSESIFNRLLIKFFKTYPLTSNLLRLINKKNKPFVLYTSWAYYDSISTPSVEKILALKLCKGHFYIEEGQLSYRKSIPYSTKIKNRLRTVYAMDSKYIYRDDSLGFIGFLSDVFPEVPTEKKFILNNYDIIKKFYQPKIEGIKTIGLTCAERRIKKHQWKYMCKKLIDKMPQGGMIKLHPSFTSNKLKRKKIELILKKISPSSIVICPDDVILEIEMLYEKKTLIGPLTSLNKYAEAFGSKFIHLDLY